jgi:predicted amidohydrolase
MYIEKRVSRGDAGSLAISGAGNAASSGGWERRVDGVEPGKWYRLKTYYKAEGLKHEPTEVVCRLAWLNAKGSRAGTPEYAYRAKPSGNWTEIEVTAPAPAGAVAVKVELWLHNSPTGTVYFDDVSFEAVAKPPSRPVIVAAVHHRPRKTEAPVQSFLQVIANTAPAKTDVILLPEGITVVGTSKKIHEVAEPIPGPTTGVLGELARKRNTYVAAGIYEREGNAIYNTAVLIDRTGNVAGKYRKVYLPREEIEAGLTAGNSYPVFDTDFGRVGLMICWDVQYADPARALALAGAELLLLPIWGGNETLTKARAIENSVFIALSGYDITTAILDRKGETVAIASNPGTTVVSTLDLNRRYEWEWLGEMRGRFMKETRLDVPVKHPVFQE